MRIRTSGLSNYVKTNMKADLPQVGDRLPVGPRQPASPHRHMRIIQRILRRLRAKEHNANLILGLRKQFPLDKQRRALQGRVEEAVPFVVQFCRSCRADIDDEADSFTRPRHLSSEAAKNSSQRKMQ